MAKTSRLNMRDLVRESLTLDVQVKGFTEWRLRKELGLLLIRFGAWIMWVGIELDELDEEKSD